MHRKRSLSCSVVFILFFFPTISSGKAPFIYGNDWKNLLHQYTSKSIGDTIYLKKIEALAAQSSKDPQLRFNLATYRKIAWSNHSYGSYRAKYYALLVTNAILSHQEGFSIYYIQKQEQELRKIIPYVNSLNEPRMLLAIYGRCAQCNIAKRLSIYNDNLPFLKSIPNLILKSDIPFLTCINAMTILNHTAQIYSIKKDSVKVIEVFTMAKNIFDLIEQKHSFSKARIQQFRLLLYMIEHAKAKVSQDIKQEWNVLHATGTLVNNLQKESPSLWLTAFERAVLMKTIDFNLRRNQIDSSRKYFKILCDRFRSYKITERGDGTDFLLYASKISALEGDYRAAYDTLLNAYSTNDSIIATKTADIHNNMYAHMVSEQRNEELKVSEVEKSKRTLIIFIIISILIIVIAIFILYLKIKSAKMRKRIEDLNWTTQIQIAEIEAKANTIQKQLGMELHDGISGNLIHICNFLTTEMIDEMDTAKKRRWQNVINLAKETYEDTRYKSHDWFSLGTRSELEAFSNSVENIVTQALPVENYENQIEIDYHSLEKVPPLTRIHLLRIIQEALANIIKHAKASKIKIFIYEENNWLTLQIIDDGKGFDKSIQSKTKSVGLQSLRNRVYELNGSFDIITSSNGTELHCNIPV